MKLGIIFAAHNAQPHLAAALQPWIDARAARLGGCDFSICAVSVPFEGFPQGPADDTLHQLRLRHAPRLIDHLISGDKPIQEIEARTQALRWLVHEGVDIVWQWDADEVTTIEEIGRVVSFVAARPQVTWFRGSLKNYVFDQRTFLVEPFTPPRIHRVQAANGYVAYSFWDDNNVLYCNPDDPPKAMRDTQFASVQIPKAVQFTPHYSWPNDERGKQKQAYQWRRWGRCSFKWDDTQGGLIWTDPTRAPETAVDP